MKNTITARHLCACLLALLLTLSALLFSACKKEAAPLYSSEIPEESNSFYVYDGAGVLDSAEAAYLTARNEALFALTGAQIVIVSVPDTGTLDVSEYARQLFNKWSIGSAERNNGILLLLSIDEDTYWLLTGKGLSDSLPNSVLQAMNNEHLEPHFAQKNYGAGVKALFDALLSHLESLYSVDVDTWSGAPGAFTRDRLQENTAAVKEKSSPAVSVIMIALVVMIAVLIIVILLIGSGGPGRKRRRKVYAAASRAPARPVHRSGYYPGTVPAPRTGAPRPNTYTDRR